MSLSGQLGHKGPIVCSDTRRASRICGTTVGTAHFLHQAPTAPEYLRDLLTGPPGRGVRHDLGLESTAVHGVSAHDAVLVCKRFFCAQRFAESAWMRHFALQ